MSTELHLVMHQPGGTLEKVKDGSGFVMVDPGASYLACAVHKMHVGAGQVCGSFSRGNPLYELK